VPEKALREAGRVRIPVGIARKKREGELGGARERADTNAMKGGFYEEWETKNALNRSKLWGDCGIAEGQGERKGGSVR